MCSKGNFSHEITLLDSNGWQFNSYYSNVTLRLPKGHSGQVFSKKYTENSPNFKTAKSVSSRPNLPPATVDLWGQLPTACTIANLQLDPPHGSSANIDPKHDSNSHYQALPDPTMSHGLQPPSPQ